jgi:predicted HicB family RNase H-like nuclease
MNDENKKTKKPGPKLKRSETCTIRLDLSTKADAIEAAWQSRRTLSSWIEYIIIEKLAQEKVK